jgi:hypothetical protein
MKPSYILNVTYPMATVIAKIHRPAVAMSAPRSMFLVVCDTTTPIILCYFIGGIHPSRLCPVFLSIPWLPGIPCIYWYLVLFLHRRFCLFLRSSLLPGCYPRNLYASGIGVRPILLSVVGLLLLLWLPLLVTIVFRYSVIVYNPEPWSPGLSCSLLGGITAHYFQPTIYEFILETHMELWFTMGLNHMALPPLTSIPG